MFLGVATVTTILSICEGFFFLCIGVIVQLKASVNANLTILHYYQRSPLANIRTAFSGIFKTSKKTKKLLVVHSPSWSDRILLLTLGLTMLSLPFADTIMLSLYGPSMIYIIDESIDYLPPKDTRFQSAADYNGYDNSKDISESFVDAQTNSVMKLAVAFAVTSLGSSYLREINSEFNWRQQSSQLRSLDVLTKDELDDARFMLSILDVNREIPWIQPKSPREHAFRVIQIGDDRSKDVGGFFLLESEVTSSYIPHGGTITLQEVLTGLDYISFDGVKKTLKGGAIIKYGLKMLKEFKTTDQLETSFDPKVQPVHFFENEYYVASLMLEVRVENGSMYLDVLIRLTYPFTPSKLQMFRSEGNVLVPLFHLKDKQYKPGWTAQEEELLSTSEKYSISFDVPLDVTLSIISSDTSLVIPAFLCRTAMNSIQISTGRIGYEVYPLKISLILGIVALISIIIKVIQKRIPIHYRRDMSDLYIYTQWKKAGNGQLSDIGALPKIQLLISDKKKVIQYHVGRSSSPEEDKLDESFVPLTRSSQIKKGIKYGQISPANAKILQQNMTEGKITFLPK